VVVELVVKEAGLDGVVTEGEEAGDSHLNDKVLFGVAVRMKVIAEALMDGPVEIFAFDARDESGP
jgi:hypothetical protein